MSVIRRGKFMAEEIGKFYTSIANQVFRDPRLSAYAKSVFGLISTHKDGYNITAEFLCAKTNPDGEGMKEGLSTVKKALRELEQYGYLNRSRLRNEDGTLGGTCYEITDMPDGFTMAIMAPDRSDPDPTDEPGVTLQPQVHSRRSGPRVTRPPQVSPPVVEPPVVTRPVEKTNNQKTFTPSLREGVNRAHDAPAHASTAPAEAASSGPPAVDARNSTSRELKPSRLPGDWRPSPTLLAWAADAVPGLDVEEETAEFVHYWSVEAPAKAPKSGRSRRAASWEMVDWGRCWQNRMKERWRRLGLDRRPKPAEAEMDLFASFDQAEAEEITQTWLAWWDQQGTVVTPTLRTSLLKLVAEALAAGRSGEQVRTALKLCREPFPAPFRWTLAMAGKDPHARPGEDRLSRAEREQKYADEKSAASWQRIMEREASGATTPNDSVREIIEASLRKSGALPEQDSTPGSASARTVLRGEIAQ